MSHFSPLFVCTRPRARARRKPVASCTATNSFSQHMTRQLAHCDCVQKIARELSITMTKHSRDCDLFLLLLTLCHLSVFIAGTQTIWVKTWGCSHNNSDSEYMAGQLAQYGYNVEIDGDGANAHLWLLNSCTGADFAVVFSVCVYRIVLCCYFLCL